jgi:hypothetical protein
MSALSRFLSMIEKRLTLRWQRRPRYAPRAKTHFIFRHWTATELGNGTALAQVQAFDGFNCDLQYNNTAEWAAVKTLANMGKLWWRYLTVFSYPYSGTTMSGAAKWHDYFRHNWQFSGSTPGSPTKYRFLLTSRTPDIVACMWTSPANGERYELTPFMLYSLADLDALATKMVSFARDLGQDAVYTVPNGGVFVDNCYLDVRYWMLPTSNTYGSGHGSTLESTPHLATAYYVDPSYWTDWQELEDVYGGPAPHLWETYTARYTYLTDKVASLLAAPGSPAMGTMGAPYRIANMPYSGPINGKQHAMPWYFENVFAPSPPAPRSYADSVAQWKQDKRNVISTRCDGGAQSWTNVLTLIQLWRENGGWIAFTDDGSAGGITQMNAAYAEAARVRSEVSG